MIVTFTDEDQMIAEVAGELFAANFRIPDDDDPAPRYTRAQWEAATNLGLSALGVADERGGLGAGSAALGAVLVESGRMLNTLPLVGSVVMVTQLVDALCDEQDRANVFAMLVSGQCIGAVAFGHRGQLHAEYDSSRGWTVSGVVEDVLDASSADLVFVSATTDDGMPMVALIDDEVAGCRITQHRSIDLTREFAEITLDRCPARVIGLGAEPVRVRSALRRTELLGRIARAGEQLGAAQRCLDMTVDYVGQRTQFGRRIAEFQAVKHRCADVAVLIDDATSALHHALWAIDQTGAESAASSSIDELAAAAALAGSACAAALTDAADAAVHLHGGIGFTWEHPAHLYYRRAVSDPAVFGDQNRCREDYLAAVGISATPTQESNHE